MGLNWTPLWKGARNGSEGKQARRPSADALVGPAALFTGCFLSSLLSSYLSREPWGVDEGRFLGGDNNLFK